MFTWVKVHRDVHVEVARALYSVPERRFAREPGEFTMRGVTQLTLIRGGIDAASNHEQQTTP